MGDEFILEINENKIITLITDSDESHESLR